MPELSGNQRSAGQTALIVLTHGLALLLAVFHGFVGYHKAFSPLFELAKHGAWTIHVPELLGKLVGWGEMAFSVALVAPILSTAARPMRRVACYFFIATEVVAAIVHALNGEMAVIDQNGVMIALSLFIIWSDRRSSAMV